MLNQRRGGWLYYSQEPLLIYAISTIPFVVTFYLILTYGVNIPFFDDWAFVDMIDKFLSGSLTFQDIWAQHNEHRPVTMKVVRLISVALTNWNLVSEMLFSALLAFLTFVVVSIQIARSCLILSIRNYGLPIFFSAISLAGLSQYENWMWGIATHWFLTNFFAVCAFVLLSNPSGPFLSFFLAAVCAVLSFISMGHGFLVLFLGLPILILIPDHDAGHLSRKWVRVSAWGAITVVVALIYWIGYTKPVDHPSLSLFLSQPVELMKYVCAYPASSLVRDFESEAIALGTISLILFVMVAAGALLKTRRNVRYYRSFMPWISIGMYVLGTDCVTAISRLGFGWDHALTGRYTTMSALFYVAMAVLMWGFMKDFQIVGQENRSGSRVGILANVLICLMIGLSLFSSARMFHKFPDFQVKRLIAMEALLTGGYKNDLLLMFPDTEFVIERNEILKRWALSFHKK